MRRRNFLSRWWFNLPMRDKGLARRGAAAADDARRGRAHAHSVHEQQRETAGLIARVAETRDTARELFIALLDLEAGMRGYALTRNAAFLERVKIARAVDPRTSRASGVPPVPCGRPEEVRGGDGTGRAGAGARRPVGAPGRRAGVPRQRGDPNAPWPMVRASSTVCGTHSTSWGRRKRRWLATAKPSSIAGVGCYGPSS